MNIGPTSVDFREKLFNALLQDLIRPPVAQTINANQSKLRDRVGLGERLGMYRRLYP